MDLAQGLAGGVLATAIVTQLARRIISDRRQRRALSRSRQLVLSGAVRSGCSR